VDHTVRRTLLIERPDLAARATIREVGPRDGSRTSPKGSTPPTTVRLIDALARAGAAPHRESASFVRADVVPQLSDVVA
jgi:hypothetical protein